MSRLLSCLVIAGIGLSCAEAVSEEGRGSSKPGVAEASVATAEDGEGDAAANDASPDEATATPGRNRADGADAGEDGEDGEDGDPSAAGDRDEVGDEGEILDEEGDLAIVDSPEPGPTPGPTPGSAAAGAEGSGTGGEEPASAGAAADVPQDAGQAGAANGSAEADGGAAGPEHSPPRPHAPRSADDAEHPDDRQVLGFVETVRFPGVTLGDGEVVKYNGRLDTGAASCSLNAVDIEPFERDGDRWVRFTMIGEDDDERVLVERPLERWVRIREHGGDLNRRPVVTMTFQIGKERYEREFNLIDREGLLYPVLLGRNALEGEILVDAERHHIANDDERVRVGD